MNDGKQVAVVRVRGRTGVEPDVNETLRLLGLTRVNHCVVLGRTSQSSGMLLRVKDFITWGEIDAPTLSAMVEKRGRLEGNKRITEAFVKAKGFESVSDLAEKVVEGKAKLSSIKELKKVFRLHPPKKGYEGIKRKYPYGALGNRGAEINFLIKRMV